MATDTAPNRPLIQQMVVIHRVFRREFGLLPVLIRDVAPDDVERASFVADHATGLLRFVHIHHSGEDEFLWPVLLERVEVEADLIRRMEDQHLHVAALIPRAQELYRAGPRSHRPNEARTSRRRSNRSRRSSTSTWARKKSRFCRSSRST